MAITEDQARAQLRVALGSFSANEIGGFLADEQMKALAAAEAAKPLPALTLSAEDWAALKTYLLDGAGDARFTVIATKLRRAMQQDDQPAFWRAMLSLFKAVRLAFNAEVMG
jgi:hypothetical protein